MRSISTRLILLTVALAMSPAPGGAQRPCSAEEHRHFDFWEGRWMVRAATGALAALEAIKIISGHGRPQYGTMLMLDAYQGHTATVRLQRRADCPCCARGS